jgi:hypothetical protein
LLIVLDPVPDPTLTIHYFTKLTFFKGLFMAFDAFRVLFKEKVIIMVFLISK